MTKKIDLSKYTVTEIPETELLVSIKSFDLQAIRERYLVARLQKGKVGSVERRPVAEGGVAKIRVAGNKVVSEELTHKLKEPRAIAQKNGRIAIGAENSVYVFDGEEKYTIESPWFSYIHTLDFHPTNDELILISSSGFDCFFEYNWITQECKRSWFAWENGWNKGFDKKENKEIWLTKDSNQATQWESEGKNVKCISDPLNQVLPTAERAAFINSALYHESDGDIVYITLFHEGAVYKIDWSTGKKEQVFNQLVSPHGGQIRNQQEMVTNTAGGEVQVVQEELLKFDFSQLPQKDPRLGELEWLQNTTKLSNGYFVTIDSNRTSFVFFNPEKEILNIIPYNSDWAVQDILEL